MTREELIDISEYGYDENKGIWSKAKKKFIKGTVEKDGYVRVGLKCVDGKLRLFMYHRAIWYLAYGPIPEGYEVNHIREFEKTNNRLCNLELVTHKENINYGTHNERVAATNRNHPLKSKHVVALDMNGNVIYEFASTREAGRNGFDQGNVAKCCRNCYMREGNRFFKGYYWYFKDEWLQMQKEIASPHKREDAIQLEINFI